MHVVSVNVKLPPRGGTAIDKRPTAGPVAVTVDGLAGDGVGNRRHHGGPDQAVYAYGTPDYAWWEAELGCPLAPATFGENLTIDGLESATLAVGDRLVVGPATLEVTSPRIPCATLAARMDDPRFIARFRAGRRPGVYLRVLTAGAVATGDPVQVERAPDGALTVLELMDLLYRKDASRGEVERALAAPIDVRSRRNLERRLLQVDG
jgi:MOSC domain-containing protein YiiM